MILRRFRDESGRAVAFFISRAGMGDTAAIEKAAKMALTSKSRIRGGVKWIRELWAMDGAEFINHLRSDADMATRIAAGGIEALTPKEIFLIGCVNAFSKQTEKMLSPEARGEHPRTTLAQISVWRAGAQVLCELPSSTR